MIAGARPEMQEYGPGAGASFGPARKTGRNIHESDESSRYSVDVVAFEKKANMANAARSRIQPASAPKSVSKISTRKAEEDFLASVMSSVSNSLEKMNDEEREEAVRSAEEAVAHLQ
jgi:hypothetical protein